MNNSAKALIGIGGVILIASIILFSWGGYTVDSGTGSPDSEDWSGYLIWEGKTPDTYTGEFTFTSAYNVWVEEDSEVYIYVYGEGDGYWDPCENWDECGLYDVDGKIPGYEYIGQIWIEDSGTYTVDFSSSDDSEVAIMIREDKSLGGFMGLVGGCGICCFGLVFLIAGLIMASSEKKSNVEMSAIVPVGTKDVVVVHDSPPQSDGEWWEESDIGKKS